MKYIHHNCVFLQYKSDNMLIFYSHWAFDIAKRVEVILVDGIQVSSTRFM